MTVPKAKDLKGPGSRDRTSSLGILVEEFGGPRCCIEVNRNVASQGRFVTWMRRRKQSFRSLIERPGYSLSGPQEHP